MEYLLWGLVLLFAIVDWVAVYKHWKRVEYICKPGTMIALLVALWVTTGLQGLAIWFSIGILLSLAGDVFLMVPANLFIPGLLAFLLAHVSYIVGFSGKQPSALSSQLLALPLQVLLIVVIGALFYWRLSTSLKEKGHSSLRIPILIYLVVISLMVLSAFTTFLKPEWSMPVAILVSMGAVLFYISDAVLAWDRFIRPIHNGRMLNMIAYHLGQAALIAGVATQLR